MKPFLSRVGCCTPVFTGWATEPGHDSVSSHLYPEVWVFFPGVKIFHSSWQPHPLSECRWAGSQGVAIRYWWSSSSPHCSQLCRFFLLLNRPELFLSLAWVNFKLAIGCPCSYLLEKSKNIHPYSILCLRLCSFSLLSYKVTQLRLYFIIFLVQVVLKRKGLASNPRSFGCEAPLWTNATLFLFLVNPSS